MESSHVISSPIENAFDDIFETDDFSMFLENDTTKLLPQTNELKPMKNKAVAMVGNSSKESDDGVKKGGDIDYFLQPSQMLSHKISMSPSLPSDNSMDQDSLGDGGSNHSCFTTSTHAKITRPLSIGHNESTHAAEKYAAMARTSAELANNIAISARAHAIENLDATVTECGSYQWPDGSVYEGDWRFGRRHGKGIIMLSHI